MSLHELNTFPGVTAQPDIATQKFVFQPHHVAGQGHHPVAGFLHSCPGFFSLVEKKRDFPEAEFSLYFLALVDKKTRSRPMPRLAPSG